MLSSPDDDIFINALARLRRDYLIFTIAVEKAKASTSIAKFIKSSPFQTRLVREIALMATLQHPGITPSDRRHNIQQYTYYIFMGWGQTKIVEDNFKNCRYVETQGILNKTRTCAVYYAAMSKMKTIALHNRTEISIDEDVPVAKGKPAEMFHCKSHTPSLTNASDITGRASWAT